MPYWRVAAVSLLLFAYVARASEVITTEVCSKAGECSAASLGQHFSAESWRQALGWTSSKLATAEVMGIRGVVATEGLQSDELVVKLPFESAINGNSMMWRTPFPEVVSQKFWSKTDSTRKVMCRVAVEIGKGDSSKWVDWLHHVPRDFDALPYWSQDELAELHDQPLAAEAMYAAEEPRIAWEGLRETTPDTSITLADWRWAWQLVNSRSFSFTYLGGLRSRTLIGIISGAGVVYLLLRFQAPTLAWWILNGTILMAIGNKAWGVLAQSWVESVAMLPILDDFNHATDPNLLLDYRASMGSLNIVVAPGGILQGEEVFISYGNATNEHYMMVYGFTVDDNPEEKYKLRDVQEKLLQHHTVSARRLQYVNNTELSRKLELVSVAETGFKTTDIQAVSQLICSDAQFVEGEDTVWKDPALEAQVLQALLQIVEDEISSWPTSVAEDDRLLQHDSEGKSNRWHLAVHYRRRRKEVLLVALGMVEQGYAVAKAMAQQKSSKKN